MILTGFMANTSCCKMECLYRGRGHRFALVMAAFVCTSVFFNLVAQSFPNYEKNKYLSVSAVYGKVEVHSQAVQNLNGTNPYGIAVDYGLHDFSKKAIDTYGCNIRFGGTAQLWQFNNESLGQGLAVLAYAEPFLLTYNRFMLSVKASAGLIALTNPYNANNNPNNQAYSTNVAFPLSFGVSVYYPLSYKWAMVFNGSINHLSNGGVKMPNEGLNYPAFSVGLEHSFNQYIVPPRKASQNLQLPIRAARQRIETVLSMALMETDEAEHMVYGIIHSMYRYRLTRINGLGGGLLAEVGMDGHQNYAASIMVGHRFYLGSFGFSQDLGLYLIDSEPDKPVINQLYAFDFQVTNHLLVGVNIKVHGIMAQYLGVRMGYVW